MKLRRVLHALSPVIALLLFCGAILLLTNILRHYHLQDITRSMREIPSDSLLLSAAFTCLSYLALTGYDMLALSYIGKPLPYRRVILASFVSYAVANNSGSLSIIASTGVRYRLYGAWGLAGGQVAKLIAFCIISFWLSLLGLGGVTLLLHPIIPPPDLHLPASSLRILGAVLALTSTGYFTLNVLRQKPFSLLHWNFPIPGPRLAAGQLAIGMADLLAFAAAAYVLLPRAPQLGFFHFVAILLLAMAIGLISNVPGGLGVFETVLVLLLAPYVPVQVALGCLLAFRGIYYLLPLAVAALALASYELYLRKEDIARLAGSFARTSSSLVPQAVSLLTFIGGVVLMFSGSTPAISSRVAQLKGFLPLPVLELSHFLGSLAGIMLLVLANGLRRRLDGAYLLSAVMLGAGAVFSILKGVDYEETIWLLFLLAILVICRKEFYRKASLLAEPFSAGWVAAIALVVMASAWLGFFSFRHVDYSHDLWWKFAFHADASRFLRAEVGAMTVALFFGAARLLYPIQPEPHPPEADELEHAAVIAARSPYTTAYLALLGDKSLLFSDSGDSFLMYGIEGRSWINMGDPVGPDEQAAELLWRFQGLCDRSGGWPVFYEVRPDNLYLYLDLGLSPVKIGEQGRVPLTDFSLAGGRRKTMRHFHNQLQKQGVTFHCLPPQEVTELLPELEAISDAWLAAKNTREKKFSLGFFNPKYLSRFPVAVARQGETILAFANLLPSARKEELTVDLMRYLPEAPKGVMDFLFIEVMLWGQKEGYRFFDLGMAPLAGLDTSRLAPAWSNIGHFIFRHGENFYNFQGLRGYKEKFDPTWEPRYLVTPGGFALPRILANLATLIGGGISGVIRK